MVFSLKLSSFSFYEILCVCVCVCVRVHVSLFYFLFFRTAVQHMEVPRTVVASEL